MYKRQQLNGVFDAAQDAAMQYMENIRRLGREQEAVCQKMEVDARKRAEDICTAANVYSRNVHLKADAYRKQVLKSLKVLLQDQEGLMKTVMKDGKEGHS